MDKKPIQERPERKSVISMRLAQSHIIKCLYPQGLELDVIATKLSSSDARHVSHLPNIQYWLDRSTISAGQTREWAAKALESVTAASREEPPINHRKVAHDQHSKVAG
jgi:hypothetical protein